MAEYDPFDVYDGDEAVSLDPKNKAPSTKTERFKGEQDRAYRVACLYFYSLEQSIISASVAQAKRDKTEVNKDAARTAIKAALAKRAEERGKSVDELEAHEKLDLKQPRFARHKTQFCKTEEFKSLLISRMGLDGPDADLVWKKCEDPRTYYWTILLVYPTDKEGTVDKEAILRDSSLKVWRFSDGVFNTLIEKNKMLKEISKDNSLASFDLKLTCKNAKFQNFDIDPAGQAIWLKVDKVRQHFLPKAVAMYEKMVDARKISTADLREKLGMGGGDSGVDVADDDEIADLIDNV